MIDNKIYLCSSSSSETILKKMLGIRTVDLTRFYNQKILKMNISFVKDPASALFGNRNPFSLPMQLVAKNAQPMQINPQLACSILSQSSIGFSTQKPLQLPLNTVLSDQRIIGPGALLNQPDLSHLQSVLTTGLIRNDSLTAAQFRNLQAETHTDDSTISKLFFSLFKT